MSPAFTDRLTSKVPDRFLKVPDKFNPYHRAHENRIGVRHPDIQQIRAKFVKAVLGNFAILQLLFFALFCYMFGSLYTQSVHTHNIQFLYTDYDGGVIGQSVRLAYDRMKGEGFPTLVEAAPATGITPDVAFMRDEVCQIRYWATLWTHPGASDRLAAALQGGSAAADYDPSDVLTFVWDEARYPTTADSVVLANLQSLSSAARVVYSTINGSGAIETMDREDRAAVAAFTNPWQVQDINIRQTNQGSRVIYNTLCIILIVIQEFFYLAALNGMYASFKIYERLTPHRIIFFRVAISLGYCFIGSLCVTGAIWIFKDTWGVSASDFAITWMVVWLFAHCTFLILDAISVWVPVMFVPMCLITWVVFNVAGILLPFELVPGFYHWSYALPAHALYSTQMDIWSGGCNPQLDINLPVLFAWELLGLTLSCIGVHRRCHYAVVAQEAQQAQFQEKLQHALDFEKRRDTERAAQREKQAAAAADSAGSRDREEEEEERDTEADARDQAEMETELRTQQSLSKRSINKVKSNVHFGPSFENPFRGDED